MVTRRAYATRLRGQLSATLGLMTNTTKRQRLVSLVVAILAVLNLLGCAAPVSHKVDELLTANVFDSSEWRRFVETIAQLQPPTPDAAALRSACERALGSNSEAVTLERRYLTCIDAATRLVDPNGWYRSYEEITRRASTSKKVRPVVSKIEGNGLLVKVPSFANEPMEQLIAEVYRVIAWQPLEFVVLDLRGNSGGKIDTVADIASLFVPLGTVLGQMRGRESVEVVASVHMVTRLRLSYQAPRGMQSARLFVLVDGETASGSELLAQSLRHHRRAEVLGQRTAGNSRVDLLASLTRRNHFLRVRQARLYGPEGRTWDESGIRIDVPLPDSPLNVEGEPEAVDSWVRTAQSRFRSDAAR